MTNPYTENIITITKNDYTQLEIENVTSLTNQNKVLKVTIILILAAVVIIAITNHAALQQQQQQNSEN